MPLSVNNPKLDHRELIVLAVSLAVALHQDYQAWPTDVALLFAAGLVSMILPFLSHFLNVSDDIKASRVRTPWLLLAGMAPSHHVCPSSI